YVNCDRFCLYFFFFFFFSSRRRHTRSDRDWSSDVCSSDLLTRNSEALVGKVDWITKRWLLQRFLAQENLDWSDPWLKAQDLEFRSEERRVGKECRSRWSP